MVKNRLFIDIDDHVRSWERHISV